MSDHFFCKMSQFLISKSARKIGGFFFKFGNYLRAPRVASALSFTSVILHSSAIAFRKLDYRSVTLTRNPITLQILWVEELLRFYCKTGSAPSRSDFLAFPVSSEENAELGAARKRAKIR